jgi:hypothetical protein
LGPLARSRGRRRVAYHDRVPGARPKATSGKAKRVEITDAMFARGRKRTLPPFAFVLDELAELDPITRPMFGLTAVYVDEKIVFALRDRPSAKADNGVWVATAKEHHASLAKELGSMRSIRAFGVGTTGWQVLPVESDTFEDDVLRACALVRDGDPRIGKIPVRKSSAPSRSSRRKRR